MRWTTPHRPIVLTANTEPNRRVSYRFGIVRNTAKRPRVVTRNIRQAALAARLFQDTANDFRTEDSRCDVAGIIVPVQLKWEGKPKVLAGSRRSDTWSETLEEGTSTLERRGEGEAAAPTSD
jgi:hypothetical protein